MKRVFYVLLFCGVSILGFSQNEPNISFKIRNLGVNVDGHFSTFIINTQIDANAELKTISGQITVSSIKTSIDNRDKHLLEEDYFDIENHKYITLESTSVTKKSSNSYSVKAKLSIKGKVQTVTIPVAIEKIHDTYKITSNFEINRKYFNVGGGSFVMSKTVKINVVHFQ